jgi:hypothetical protein
MLISVVPEVVDWALTDIEEERPIIGQRRKMVTVAEFVSVGPHL